VYSWRSIDDNPLVVNDLDRRRRSGSHPAGGRRPIAIRGENGARLPPMSIRTSLRVNMARRTDR
jgi:hypothetical protein